MLWTQIYETKFYNITVIPVNAQSLTPRHLDITQYLPNVHGDLCIVMKMWLWGTTPDEALKNTDLNNIYTMWNANRIGRKGGGIAIVVAKRCIVTNVRKLGGVDTEILDIYHSPYSKEALITNATFVDEISELMNDIWHTRQSYGDFNLHVEREDDLDAF